MKNRIIFGAVLSLALILTPALAPAKPTRDVKKKKVSLKSSSKTRSKKSKKRYSSRSRKPVQAQMYGMTGDMESGTASSSLGVAETKPLMRVIPQRDGRFMLEPMTPKKPGKTSTRSIPPPPTPRDTSQGFHKWEPWNFSELVLTRARGYCGAPYRRGSSLEYSSATDCSGFVQYIFHGFMIDLPRSSSEQAQVGKVVTHSMDFSKLLPGDLLFFRRGGRWVGHSGIYLGEGKMIHASNHRNGVTITDLRQPYYQNTFVVAKRVFEVKYAN